MKEITMKQYTPFLLAAGLTLASVTTYAADDWRKSADQETKVKNLVKVMPGASDIMLQMGERYKNLYWAGEQKKWKFAEYQVEEMEALINTLIITRPKRAKTAKEFLATGFSQFHEAIEHQDWARFEKAFQHMRTECMTCHAKNDHSFIVLPKKPPMGSSPVLAD